MKLSEKRIPIEKLCEYLGEDLDSPLCKEISDHIREHPHCKIYLDSIRKTVFYVKTAIGEDEECRDALDRLKIKVSELLSPDIQNSCKPTAE